jgi:hypothetical protein
MKHAVAAWISIAAVFIGGGACRQSAATNSQSTSPRSDGVRGSFAITPWELGREKQELFDQPGYGIGSLRECGFNTVAFVRPDQLEKVERAGMRAIVGRPGARVDWRRMSNQAIAKYVAGVVGAAGESDAVLGYFLADEPSAAEFPALGKAVAALKRLAPGKLAYINLFPNYATAGDRRSQLGVKSYAEYLRRYLAIVGPQLISYDNYSVEYSLDLRKRARAAKYYTNLLQVRRAAAKHGLPFWNAVSSNRIRPYTTRPSPENLRLQAYTTLAAGARGLTWFTYYAGRYDYAPINRAGRRTATWSYLKAVNKQVSALTPILTRLRSTGVYFAAPAPARGLPLLPGKLVRSVASPAPVMVGEFSGAGSERYVMVVNLSLERSAKVVVKARAKSMKRVSPVDRSLRPLTKGSLWLAAGQGMLLKLQGRAPERAFTGTERGTAESERRSLAPALT